MNISLRFTLGFLILFFSAAAAEAVPCTQPIFQAGEVYDTANWPWDIDKADINGDGRMDIVVANFDGNGGPNHSLSAFVAKSGGGFEQRIDSSSGTPTWGVRLGDLDRDGKADAVVRYPDGIRILLGDGSGRFTIAKEYAFYKPNSIIIADANHDSKPDLLISAGDFYYGSIYFFPGVGDGSFAAPVIQELSEGTGLMTAADLNKDGSVDLVLGSSGGVTSFRGNGDGTFSEVWSSRSSNGAVFAGNFDGDGKTDVVVMQRDFHWVQLLQGNGDGTFTLRERFNVGEVANNAAVGDVDHDGLDDVVTTNFASNEVSVLLARPQWGFAKAVNYTAAAQAAAVVIDEFSGDGHADLVTVGTRDKIQYGRESYALLTPGRGDGTFIAPVNYPLFNGAFPNSVAAADLNNDGREDIITGNSETWGVSVLVRTGPFTFDLPRHYLPQTYINAIVVTDVNGDQKPDVAAVGFQDLYILLNGGDGTLIPSQPVKIGGQGAFANSITSADLDGDLDRDLVITDRDHGDLITIPNNGDGTFGSLTSYQQQAYPRGVAVADLNQDQKPDIVLAADALFGFIGGVTVHLNGGTGQFPSKAVYTIGTSLHPTGVAVADLNSDGHPDVAVTTMHDATEYVELRRFMGSASGTLQAKLPEYSVRSVNPWHILAGDLDGDGISDLVTTNYTSEDVTIFKTLPGGDLEISQQLPAGEQSRFAALGQLNSDTSPDLIVTNYNGSSLTLMANECGLSEEKRPGKVTVSGRVVGADGRGIRGAVSLTSSDGRRNTVTSSTLGYFDFSDVPAGGVYTINVASKRFRFSAKTFRLDYAVSFDPIVGVE